MGQDLETCHVGKSNHLVSKRLNVGSWHCLDEQGDQCAIGLMVDIEGADCFVVGTIFFRDLTCLCICSKLWWRLR